MFNILLFVSPPDENDINVSLRSMIDNAVKIERQGKIDHGIDAIYAMMNTIFYHERYSEFDSFLLNADTEKYSTDMLISLLTISAHFKDKLKHRRDFYESAVATLSKRPEWETNLLIGLE